MKQALSILLGYLTCDDAAVKTKWANLLASYWHKDEGKIVTSISTATNGDVTIVIKDGNGNTESTTISKTQLPNSYEISFINGLQDALNSKVDAVPGKGLSTHDFTTTLKQKLEALQNYVHPATHSITEVDGLQPALDAIPTKTSDLQNDSGFLTAGDGKTYHISRSDTNDVAPTTAEVANPKAGDTADVMLRDGTLSKFRFDGTTWRATIRPINDVLIYTKRGPVSPTSNNMISFVPQNSIFTLYPSTSQTPTLLLPENFSVADNVFIELDMYMSSNVVSKSTFFLHGNVSGANWSNSNALVNSKKGCVIRFGKKGTRWGIQFDEVNRGGYLRAVFVIKNISIDRSTAPIDFDVWKTGWALESSVNGTDFTTSNNVNSNQIFSKASITIKDYLNNSKFSGSEIGFSEDFEFDSTNKRVKLKSIAPAWKDITMKHHFYRGNLIYRKTGNVVEIRGHHLQSDHTNPDRGWLCDLPAEIRPPSSDGTRAFVGYLGDHSGVFGLELNSSGIRFGDFGNLPTTVLDIQITYTL